MTAGMVLCMYRLKLGFLSSFVEDLCAISTLFSLEHHPVVFVIELVLVNMWRNSKLDIWSRTKQRFTMLPRVNLSVFKEQLCWLENINQHSNPNHGILHKNTWWLKIFLMWISKVSNRSRCHHSFHVKISINSFKLNAKAVTYMLGLSCSCYWVVYSNGWSKRGDHNETNFWKYYDHIFNI